MRERWFAGESFSDDLALLRRGSTAQRRPRHPAAQEPLRFALEPMTRDESRDIYQLFVERTGKAATIITKSSMMSKSTVQSSVISTSREVIEPALTKEPQQVVTAVKYDVESGVAGDVSERVGDEGLADANRTENGAA